MEPDPKKLKTDESPSKFDALNPDAEIPYQDNEIQDANDGNTDENTNTDSIFQHSDISNIIGSIGSDSDLFKLRNISEEHHKIINPVNIDNVGKSLSLSASHAYDIEELSYDEKTWNCTIEELTHGFSHPEISDWTPCMAHRFRNIMLDYIWGDRDNVVVPGGVKWDNLLSQLSPHITTMKIIQLPTRRDTNLTAEKLFQFMNQFTMLKQLHIAIYDWTDLSKLETMITALKSDTMITIAISSKHEELFTKYQGLRKFPNITWIFELGFSARITDDGHNNFVMKNDDEDKNAHLDELEIILTKYGTIEYPNLKYKIYQSIWESEELEKFTKLCAVHQEKIVGLSLTLMEDNFEDDFAVCSMGQLCNLVTGIALGCRISNWSELGANRAWPKLSRLVLCPGFTDNLEILKNCPKLERLAIFGFQDRCIFYKSKKPDHEIINEYFGNLSNLKMLAFLWSGKIAKGNYLENYLKGLLSKDAIIEYPPPEMNYFQNLFLSMIFDTEVLKKQFLRLDDRSVFP